MNASATLTAHAATPAAHRFGASAPRPQAAIDVPPARRREPGVVIPLRAPAQDDTDAEKARLRHDLIANVSHDLRTPLVALRGYLETLVLKGDTLEHARRAEYLSIALRQSECLTRLVNELFELMRLDYAGVTLACEAFPFAELAGDVLQKFQLQAETLGVRLRIDTAPGLPLVEADLGLIERVLDNLIGNALKHTPCGGEVCIAMQRVDGRLQIEVSDTGCGIPAGELPFVFDRHFRGRADAGAPGNAGLGLAITHRILELHDSRIEVASRCGAGTRFTFALPLAAGATH